MKILESLLLAVVALFAPIQSIILSALALIISDLVVGIIAAHKRKEAITSSGIKRTVGKILLYELAICLAYLVQTYFTGDTLPACKLVSSIIALTELKSILENLDEITGQNLFQAVLNRIVSRQNQMTKRKKRKNEKKK